MRRVAFRGVGQKKRVYTVNLDPAVRNLAYPINVDIRDTVNYKEAGLGPKQKGDLPGLDGAPGETCLRCFAPGRGFPNPVDIILVRIDVHQNFLVGWPAGWLAVWLAGWLVVWSACVLACLIGWLVGWLVGCLID